MTRALRYLALAAFIVLVIAPLLVNLIDALVSLVGSPADSLALLMPSGRRLRLLLSSLAFAAGTGLFATAIGFAGALALAGTRLARTRLRWFPLVLAPIPPYIHALAWSRLLSVLAEWLSSSGLPLLPVQGWAISCWVQVMALLPIATGLAMIGLQSIDSESIDAACIRHPDVVVLGRVILPLAAPYLLASCCLLMVLAVVDYSVPALFSVTTCSLDIFAELSTSHDAGLATLVALPLLVTTGAVVILLQGPLRQTSALTAPPPRPRPRIWTWPFWLTTVSRLALLILIAQVVVPLLVLVVATGSPAALWQAVADNRHELGLSLVVAVSAGLAGVVPALAVATRLTGNRPGRLWWLLTILPLAIPASMTGIGLTRIWGDTLLATTEAGAAMPLLAALARFTPFSTIILLARMRRIEQPLLNAVDLFQPSLLRGWWLRLQLLAPALLAAAGVTAALAMGELGATLIVVPPGCATVSMKIYGYLHYGASQAVAGLCLLVAAVTAMTGALVAVALTNRRSRAGGPA
jgi:iron(III) transport system permease protein